MMDAYLLSEWSDVSKKALLVRCLTICRRAASWALLAIEQNSVTPALESDEFQACLCCSRLSRPAQEDG